MFEHSKLPEDHVFNQRNRGQKKSKANMEAQRKQLEGDTDIPSLMQLFADDESEEKQVKSACAEIMANEEETDAAGANAAQGKMAEADMNSHSPMQLFTGEEQEKHSNSASNGIPSDKRIGENRSKTSKALEYNISGKVNDASSSGSSYGVIYTVIAEDTVYHIANRVFKGVISIDDILAINPEILMLTNEKGEKNPQILIGQELIIPLNIYSSSYNALDIQKGQNKTLWKSSYGFGYSKTKWDDVLFNIGNFGQTDHDAALAGQLRIAYQYGKHDRRNGYANIVELTTYLNYPRISY